MATINLTALRTLRKEPLSVCDVQKLVEYRNIPRWVKTSTLSIYKEMTRLEEKGYITSSMIKEGRTAEKAVYSLTGQRGGESEYLMEEVASESIRIFPDFSAVVINLDSITPEKREACLEKIEDNIKTLKTYLEENVGMKEGGPEIPRTDVAVLKQQQILAFTTEDWIKEVKRDLSDA